MRRFLVQDDFTGQFFSAGAEFLIVPAQGSLHRARMLQVIFAST